MVASNGNDPTQGDKVDANAERFSDDGTITLANLRARLVAHKREHRSEYDGIAKYTKLVAFGAMEPSEGLSTALAYQALHALINDIP